MTQIRFEKIKKSIKSGLGGEVLPMMVIIFLHVSFFLAALTFCHIYTLDSPEYLFTGQNISNYGISYNGDLSAVIKPELYSLRPPGYGLFIELSHVLYNSDYMMLFFQNALSICFLGYLYYSLKSINAIKNYSLLFIAGLIFFPVYLILINMVMAEALLFFMLFGSWYALNKFLKKQNPYYILIYNICLVFAVFTKPVMMYFWVPNIIFGLYLCWKIKKKYPLLMTIILPVMITIWSYRNFDRTGYFHFSSIKTQNLLEINAGSVVSYSHSHEFMKTQRKEILEKAESIESYKEKSTYVLNEATKIIKEHPVLYLTLHLKGMFNFMLAPGRVDMETFVGIKEGAAVSLIYEIEKKSLLNGLRYYFLKTGTDFGIVVIIITLWNLLSLMLLIAAFLNDKLDITIRIFFFLLIGYIVFACGPGGYARFKTSIYPFILYLMPLGWEVLRSCYNKLSYNSSK